MTTAISLRDLVEVRPRTRRRFWVRVLVHWVAQLCGWLIMLACPAAIILAALALGLGG